MHYNINNTKKHKAKQNMAFLITYGTFFILNVTYIEQPVFREGILNQVFK